ncbi:MAG: AmmeMemoRadiSam system protein A [Treponema sp.]|jgi:AmmeMemoRadiSam system protein A|nr:AmmeMemoRadiSam system protein A [Treponema sp.]
MNFTINEQERRFLLADAREAIAAEQAGRSPVFKRDEAIDAGTSALTKPCGAFVTLHKTGADGSARLRGCIGRMQAAWPLEQTVRRMAQEAAFDDPRFPPLAQGELEQCRIEISVLSPMERCADPRSVQVGVHGLYLIHRGRAGVLLPQVPVEQGWDRDAYLDYICVKAGLPAGSYEAPGAELYTFTAQVFGEE